MSSQLKDKQPQKDNKRDLDADSVFNQQLFSTLAYAGAGFGAGLVASVFLKNRKALTLLGAGTGAAYGASNFMNELNSFNKFKDYANQTQQSNTLKREDQLSTKNWEDFMPKQESQTQQKRHGGSGDDDDKKGSKSSSESKSSDNKKGSDKDSHHSSSQKPSSSKSSTPAPKESTKSSQEQQKGKESDRSESSKHESKSDSKGQGQNLQDFKTNPGAGKPAPGDSRLYRGAERDVHTDNDLDELKNQQNRLVQQDKWSKSTHTGNKMKVEQPPENIAGGQFSGRGLTAGSQVNAVIE